MGEARTCGECREFELLDKLTRRGACRVGTVVGKAFELPGQWCVYEGTEASECTAWEEVNGQD